MCHVVVHGTTVTLLGDVNKGRTVYLLASLLFLLYSVHLNFVSPPSPVMPLDVVSVARKADVHVDERESQGDVFGETDVLYVMRVQKERFADEQE
jgi:carbamoyl-phosphate synthase/aspartate carbamoyltransferase